MRAADWPPDAISTTAVFSVAKKRSYSTLILPNNWPASSQTVPLPFSLLMRNPIAEDLHLRSSHQPFNKKPDADSGFLPLGLCRRRNVYTRTGTSPICERTARPCPPTRSAQQELSLTNAMAHRTSRVMRVPIPRKSRTPKKPMRQFARLVKHGRPLNK